MEMYKKLVFYRDLSPEAKEKARQWYASGNDYDMLPDLLGEFISYELEKKGYTVEGLKVFYSLSYSQGDGVSFSCELYKGKKHWKVEQHDRHYFHEYTMKAVLVDDNGDEQDDEPMTIALRSIAQRAEKLGYDEIEFQDSDENISKAMEANEYTFTLEGVRMDGDK